ncbi:MAG: hypothetical protein JXB08_01015 [Bacilli bacterium]|nr:hypothetical protein [Bacilli bacterium]MBN2877213.1 hypothetical protein [Bacilli bacterium]
MKRRVLGLLLFLLIIPFFMGCDQTTTTEQATTQATTTQEQTTLYSQAVLGTVTIQIITQGDDPGTEAVETEYVSYAVEVEFLEDDTLFGLILENFTVTYEESDFGRYLTSIGTLVPTEANQYVSFYIDGDYAMTGVDATDLVDGAVYQFKIESF